MTEEKILEILKRWGYDVKVRQVGLFYVVDLINCDTDDTHYSIETTSVKAINSAYLKAHEVVMGTKEEEHF